MKNKLVYIIIFILFAFNLFSQTYLGEKQKKIDCQDVIEISIEGFRDVIIHENRSLNKLFLSINFYASPFPLESSSAKKYFISKCESYIIEQVDENGMLILLYDYNDIIMMKGKRLNIYADVEIYVPDRIKYVKANNYGQ